MRVLHLSTYDVVGGAARAAWRQHTALRRNGVDSRMLVRFKRSHDERIASFSPQETLVQRLARRLRRRRLEAFQRQLRRTTVAAGAMTDDRGDVKQGFQEALQECDVVNLHQLGGFIDYEHLFRALPERRAVVVTMHDMAPFTGGCHYAKECEGFTHECGSCPRLRESTLAGFAAGSHRRKRQAYRRLDPDRLAFVADSAWLHDQAQRSGMLAGAQIETIHYGIDPAIYHSDEREACRRALQIDAESPVVMFAAGHLSQPEKGFGHLCEALSQRDRETVLLTVGDGPPPVLPANVDHIAFGPLSNDRLLAAIYRASDVFVIPSLTEAFGQTALEAAACGTPVAGFRAGGIPDIVEDGVNGRLAPVGDATALAAAIGSILSDAKMRNRWPQQAGEWVKTRFSYEQNAAKYVRLYEQLLAN